MNGLVSLMNVVALLMMGLIASNMARYSSNLVLLELLRLQKLKMQLSCPRCLIEFIASSSPAAVMGSSSWMLSIHASLLNAVGRHLCHLRRAVIEDKHGMF